MDKEVSFKHSTPGTALSSKPSLDINHVFIYKKLDNVKLCKGVELFLNISKTFVRPL